jgi:hypothetical protein
MQVKIPKPFDQMQALQICLVKSGNFVLAWLVTIGYFKEKKCVKNELGMELMTLFS